MHHVNFFCSLVTEDCNIFHSQSTVKTLESASQLPYRHMREELTVKITYFVPDTRKNGGAYNTLEGCVQKIDENSKSLRIQGTEILVDKIYQIDFIRATL